MYKIFPISGLKLHHNLRVPTNYVRLGNIQTDSPVIFVNREYLSDISSGKACSYGAISVDEAKEAMTSFLYTESFAVMDEYHQKKAETYYLRVAISILRCAVVEYYNERTSELWMKNVWDDYKYNECADVKIGLKPYSTDDFDIYTPCVYSEISETPTYKRFPPYVSCDMEVSYNIQANIDKIAMLLKYSIATNVKSAMNFFYYTLPQNNMDLSVVYLSSVLEALLTEENEDFIRKKISVRAACLVSDTANIKSINYFANWIYQFYKYRCDIVHNAKTIVMYDGVELPSFNRALMVVKYCTPIILSKMVDFGINTFDNLKDYVEGITKSYGYKSAFEFITETLTFDIEE